MDAENSSPKLLGTMASYLFPTIFSVLWDLTVVEAASAPGKGGVACSCNWKNTQYSFIRFLGELRSIIKRSNNFPRTELDYPCSVQTTFSIFLDIPQHMV